jgi:hypothetical protein
LIFVPIEKYPFLANIRAEPRFQKLMERVKYEWEHFEVKDRAGVPGSLFNSIIPHFDLEVGL